ncbi:MAG: hypothetical protein AAF298_02125 [Cyanobacteria bacterium P01_A01_bin.40]
MAYYSIGRGELAYSDICYRVMISSAIWRNPDGEKLNYERRETACL